MIDERSLLDSSGDPSPAYSAVIPVFNSAAVVGDAIDACVAFFEEQQLTYEIVLVDDGSTDESWNVLERRAADNDRIVAVRLLRNYGQHSAVHCGLTISRGESVVILDDDLQTRPSEFRHLIAKAAEGSDLVFGKFRKKRHSPLRRLGSWLTNYLNTAVFGKPKDLVLTNFKLIRRDVVSRILSHRTHAPYINGLAVLYARHPANVPVEHYARTVGASNYGPARLLEVLARILFNYSAFPLRLLAAIGMIVAMLSFGFGAYIFVKALLVGTSVPGWASVAVMLALLNGTTLLMLGVIGEYLIRVLQQTSMTEPYHVIETTREE